ncbi:MAG: hypothetical protein ABII26_12055 [Pseudomonadota bacterium]
MSLIQAFDQALTRSERRIMARLTTPYKIQSFLDDLTYSIDDFYRCPIRVLKERIAHCFDGALFAAAGLRRLGSPPLVQDLLPNDRDDDHMLAPYKCHGHWGAVAKSNFVGLRFREPIYRTLRELVMSYFEHYFNVKREKTLRGYTVPLNLKVFDRFNWMICDDHLETIALRLDEIRRVSLLTRPMITCLSPVDRRSYSAGLCGATKSGLYRPPR